MTRGRSCTAACSALGTPGLSVGTPIPLILLSFITLSSLFMVTQVKNCVLLMTLREEESGFQVSVQEPDFREALIDFDGAALFTSNSTRKKKKKGYEGWQIQLQHNPYHICCRNGDLEGRNHQCCCWSQDELKRGDLAQQHGAGGLRSTVWGYPEIPGFLATPYTLPLPQAPCVTLFWIHCMMLAF